jgi:hypothetical protein
MAAISLDGVNGGRFIEGLRLRSYRSTVVQDTAFRPTLSYIEVYGLPSWRCTEQPLGDRLGRRIDRLW